MTKILSFDIATKSGWAFGTEKGIEASGSFSCKKFRDAYSNFNDLIDKWKPDIIISAKPTRFYAAIRKQSEYTGLLLLLAERRDITVYKDIVDSSAKKSVLGRGNATKEDICTYFNISDEDEADAMMFVEYWIKEKL